MSAFEVSVAMATFNGGHYLREQLESLAAQEVMPFELVVSDDGSTDDTLLVLRKWAGSAPFPVRIHENPKRLGYVDNFFSAMSMCRGSLIALSDQDDVWHPTKLRICLSEFELRPDTTLVGHAARVVNAELRPARHRYPDIRRHEVHSPGTLPVWTRLPGFATVISRRLLEAAPYRQRPRSARDANSGLSSAMAHDDWCTFVGGALGRAVLLPQELSVYRRHDSNTGGAFGHASLRSSLAQVQRISSNKLLYERQSALATQRAAYLRGIRGTAGLLVAERDALDRASALHERVARSLSRRAAFYSHDGLRGRAKMLVQHLAAGDYRAVEQGGHGARALVKELVVGLGRAAS